VKLDKELGALLMIQSIDIRFDEIKREKDESPKEIEKLKENLDLLSNAMEQDLSTIEELKKVRRAVERELEEVEIKFQKSKSRLNDVKSNKEYQAVLKEIEELKELIFKKEEVVIKCMEDIEIQEEECADNNGTWKESQKEYKNKQEEFSQRMIDLDKEVQSLNGKRTQLCQNVDKNLLERYNRLRKNLRGMVVTQVINTICQGCNLGIPPQQYNELIKGGSIRSCPNCNRIIYWGDERET
jgi:predicted  nucleic acid-binding Zn-ribbon protein